jgi:Domain of unknown function (DUF4328)
VIGLVLDVETYSVLDRLQDGLASEAIEELEAVDRAASTNAVLWLLSLIGTGVVFLCWEYRAHSNLLAFNAAGLRFSPSSAVGWWFAPFLNLIRPMQVMDELWAASGPEWPAGTQAWQANGVAPVVRWWWVLWIFSWALAFIGGQRFDEAAASINEAMRAVSYDIIIDVVLVAGAVVAIAVVGDIVDRQQRRALNIRFVHVADTGTRVAWIVAAAVVVIGAALDIAIVVSA